MAQFSILDLWVLLLLVLVVRGWARVIRNLWRGEPILSWQTRRAIPWGLIDLVALFCLIVMITIGLSAFSKHVLHLSMSPAEDADLNIDPVALNIMTLSYLIWLPLAIATLVLFRGANASDFGFDRRHIVGDLILGGKTFCMLAPLVFGLQGLLVALGWESHHPIIDSMRTSMRTSMLLAGGIAAVIAAPLFEEFVFRLLFQGWLENVTAVAATVFSRPRSDEESALGQSPPGRMETVWYWAFIGPSAGDDLQVEERKKNHPSDEQPVTAEVLRLEDSLDNPYSSPEETDTASATPPSVQSLQLPAPWSYIPILISTTVFALLHYGHGPDWIPLLVLAAGLGYVYQRTHRILPCIVVHFLLNAISYGMLLLQVAMQ